MGTTFNKLYWYQIKIGNCIEDRTRSKLVYSHYIIKAEDPKGEKVCLFSSFSHGEVIADYVIEYLRSLKALGYEIVFVSTSNLNKDDLAYLEEYCSVIIERENIGLDFASWQCALKEFNFGKDFKEILLVNDSVLPVNDKLCQAVSAMSKEDCDVWGMTESDEYGRHLQSYFLSIGKNVLNSSIWKNFWLNLAYCSNKSSLVYNYEIGLSRKLYQNFKVRSYIDNDDLVKPSQENALEKAIGFNPSICYWRELIQGHKYPFLKREILFNAIKDKTCYDELKSTVPNNKFKQIEEYMQVLKKYA